MRGTKLYAMLAAMFMAGAFLASPELRVYAANTIGSADIVNESILSMDIKNGEVKAADIATDAVGASELQGVTKLIFAKCNADSAVGNGGSQGVNIGVHCNIVGVDAGDNAVALMKGNKNFCWVPTAAIPGADKVEVRLMNTCPGSGIVFWKAGDTISIIVYDK